MKKRRIVCVLLLSVVFGLLLPGCGTNTQQFDLLGRQLDSLFSSEPGQTEWIQESITGQIENSDDYFEDVWHDQIEFSEIQYTHYDIAQFSHFADQIRAFSDGDGDPAAFQEADYAILDELYYVYTLSALAQIAYSQDTTDANAAQENMYTTQLCYDAMALYQSAMHDVAVSSNREVMASAYADWQINSFAAYVSADDITWASLAQEELLIQKYYSLIGAETADYDAVMDVFIELVQLRQALATDYGYDSYADYAYDYLYTRSYTPSDVQSLWRSVKEIIVPLIEEYGELVYLDSMDVYMSDRIDCSEEAVLQSLADTLPSISPKLAEAYSYMIQNQLYDITPSATKMNTGYTMRLNYYNAPFIFNAATGTYYDYTDLFHEFGHFVNQYYTLSDLIFGWPDNDLGELQSQGMEIMMMPYYEDVFGGADGDVIRADMRMNMLYSITDGTMYDEFLQRVYASQNLSPEKVRAIFSEVYHAYGNAEYDGWENSFMSIAHNFEYPFYYISYAVSAIPALELGALLEESPQEAINRYLQVAAMDTELYYYMDALEEAGFQDPFTRETLQQVADAAAVWFQP